MAKKTNKFSNGILVANKTHGWQIKRTCGEKNEGKKNAPPCNWLSKSTNFDHSRWQLTGHIADVDELVLENLADFWPRGRLCRQHGGDQVLGRAADFVLGDDVLARFDPLVRLLQRLGLEWRFTHQQRVHNAA